MEPHHRDHAHQSTARLVEAPAAPGNPGLAAAPNRGLPAQDATDPDTLISIGRRYCAQGEPEAGCAYFSRAARLDPDSSAAWANLGAAHIALYRYDEGISAYKRSLSCDSRQPVVWNNLAAALSSRRQVGDALVCLQQSIGMAADLPIVHSNYLLSLNYDPSIPPEAVFGEHRQWEARYAANPVPPPVVRPDWPGRPIRVGYVSGSFFEHAFCYNFRPVLTSHTRPDFEITCYSNGLKKDSVTDWLMSKADHWRDIAGMSDEDACALMASDGIDILVDLSGHTEGNRLTLFTRRPAPLQVTWQGYPNTTGLKAIDFRFTCPLTDPPGTTEHLHTEELVRLEGGFLCYEPPEWAPPVNPLPAMERGSVTFGCFNNIPKVTDEALDAWAAILYRSAGSRLVLKSRGFGSAILQAGIRERFAGRGVDPERVEMLEFSASPVEHLSRYHQVDIGLDTWPYNGTTTTCEAFWMGVPVVTIAGRVHAARVGLALSTAVGLEDMAAISTDDYVAKALALASDLERLEDLRSGFRSRMLRSPLMNTARLIGLVEAAYVRMMARAHGSRNS